jgi:hypothetical protein
MLKERIGLFSGRMLFDHYTGFLSVKDEAQARAIENAIKSQDLKM